MNGKEGKQNKIYLSQMNEAAPGFWHAAWRRLKKNKGAMGGMLMIIIALFIAAFSYVIAPDPSPFANRIILEIGGQKPGFSQEFLLVQKSEIESTGFLSTIF